jgi:glycosyltransferase involved in cell wall biosynthesis
MKLSVRLITYNQEAFIATALDSIFMQKTNFSFEIVVGDDFSTDKTLNLIHSYSSTNKIHLNVLKRSKGDEYWKKRQEIGRLYNFANVIDNCRGEYIALLDGDDYWSDPYKLQKQVDFLDSNPQYVLSGHYVDRVDEKLNITPAKLLGEKSFSQNEICKIHIPTLSAVFRNQNSRFPKSFYLTPSGDYILWSILGNYGDFYIHDESMAVYRQHQGGIWSGVSLVKKLKNSILTREISLEFINDKELSNNKNKKLCISGMYRSLKTFDFSNFFFFAKIYIKKIFL